MESFVSFIRGALRAWFAEVRDLLFPRGCAGCDAPDEVLCPACRALFAQPCLRVLPNGHADYCYACSMYQGRVRHAILAWKDHSDEECDPVFASLLADSVLEVLGARGWHNPATCPLVLVPAPSSASSMRRRGRWQMLPLVKAMRRDLSRCGFQVRVKPVLRLEGVRGKSVQRAGASARSERIAGHVRVDETLLDGDSLFVIIDDIVTTGVTMGHCATALRRAGAVHVIGVALACVVNRASAVETSDMKGD